MRKKIQDYLPLYIGCRIKVGEGAYMDLTIERLAAYHHSEYVTEFKLLLRPLPNLTDEECLIIANLFGGAMHLGDESKIHQVRELFSSNGYYKTITNRSGNDWNKVINYCRSVSIDMDGLIESGLAIDKTGVNG